MRLRSLFVLLFTWFLAVAGSSQTVIPFTSGPIPPCGTSTFTANVGGIGTLEPPGSSMWGAYWINSLTMNITSEHPQTLQITLTSPEGTDLLLSAFNGAGGQNYTNTSFEYYGWGTSITTGSAPFTGSWTAEGGGLNVFDYENADGIWTITVVDTACGVGGTGPGGTWTPGWFDGSGANGGFAMAFDAGPPPCWGGIPSGVAYLCPGASVDLTAVYAGTGYTISYLENWTPIPDPTFVTAPGFYQIDATDPWDGCWYSATYEIYAEDQIDLGPDQVVDQCDASVPVDLPALFAFSGVMQAWSLDGVPISAASASAATTSGVYQFIGMNNGGCNDTALVTLNFNSSAALGPDQAFSICAGEQVDLTALYNTAGLTASWSYGGAPFLTPAVAVDDGVYTLDVMTADGCTDMADVTITIEVPPSMGADMEIDLCSNGTLDLTSLYVTTGFVPEWTLSGVPVTDPTSVDVVGTYRLVVANGASCTDTAFVEVNGSAAPSLGDDVPITACEGNTVDLTSNFGIAGLTTVWTVAGTTVPDPTAVDASGTYSLVATTASGCSDTALVYLSIEPNPVLGADQSLTQCSGSMVDLTALYATGAYATTWTLMGVPVADPTAVTSAGAYTLTATDANGCAATALVTVDMDPVPDLGTDASAAICAGASFDLGPIYGALGSTGAWSYDGDAVADPSLVDVEGDYQLVVSNAFNCSDTAVVALTVNELPVLGDDLSFDLCPWQSVDLSAVLPVGAMTALYSLDGQSVDDPSAIVDAGIYVVSVTNADGCSDEALVTVSNIECLCEADFEQELQCMQDPARFTLVADSLILGAHWDFGDAARASDQVDPVVQFNVAKEVLVTLDAILSCGVVRVERMVNVEDCSDVCTLWIPSSFTPDNDGINDEWSWVSDCAAKELSVQIYDRWGELVFSSTDPYGSWDGSVAGKPVPAGVYAYRTGYQLPYQEPKEAKGSITVVR